MSEIERGDRLVADELREALRASGIEKEIVVVEEASSTNDLACQTPLYTVRLHHDKRSLHRYLHL